MTSPICPECRKPIEGQCWIVDGADRMLHPACAPALTIHLGASRTAAAAAAEERGRPPGGDAGLRDPAPAADGPIAPTRPVPDTTTGPYPQSNLSLGEGIAAIASYVARNPESQNWPGHRFRVVFELDNLSSALRRLVQFTWADEFDELEVAERELLLEQAEHMRGYEAALLKRLTYWRSK